jgi:hypothetical protein
MTDQAGPTHALLNKRVWCLTRLNKISVQRNESTPAHAQKENPLTSTIVAQSAKMLSHLILSMTGYINYVQAVSTQEENSKKKCLSTPNSLMTGFKISIKNKQKNGNKMNNTA